MRDPGQNPSPEEILERLDKNNSMAASSYRGANRREDPRWRFRRMGVPVSIEHPGGGVRRLLVTCRNISTGGLAFIHKSYLHPGTTCMVVLTKRDSRPMPVRASVVNCRYVMEGVHEVGLKFEQRIQIHHILNTNDAGTQATTSVELPDLRGRMLYLDDNPMDQMLLNHHIRASGIDLTAVQSAEQALTAIKNNSFDIVMTDLNLGPKMDSVAFITSVRELNFSGPILLVTADASGHRASAARAAGATHVLSKPYDPRELYELLVALHRQTGAVVMSKVLYSAMEDVAEMRESLEKYVGYCNELADTLEQVTRSEQVEEARQMVLNIKGTAEGYGFATVGDAAGDAATQLDATMSCREAKPQIRTLCLLLKSMAIRKSGKPGANS